MGRENFLAQGLQLPQDRHYRQNMVDTSQHFPNEVGELQYNLPANELDYHTTELGYTSMNNTIARPPAPMGPNVLEWSVHFIHTQCRILETKALCTDSQFVLGSNTLALVIISDTHQKRSLMSEYLISKTPWLMNF